ncbi:MAG: transglutaminase-like domain-containing protein [Burkholderiales bacterium]
MASLKAATGLVAAALTLWAVATGQWLAGAILILCLEGTRAVRSRWDFDRLEFERITDLTTIGLVVFLGWQWVSLRNAGDAVMSTLVWSPAFLAPLVILQRLSSPGVVPLSALFWSLRKRAVRGERIGSVAIDSPYLCVCLLAAASTAPAGRWFLPAVVAVAAPALFQARPRPRAALPWVAAMIGAVGIAVALQAGLVAMQQQVEAWVLDYLRLRLSGRHDATRSQTAIGDIGALKLSDSILFRVQTPGRGGIRLRDGIFDTFSYDSWFSRGTSTRTGQTDGEFGWRLGPGQPIERVRIAAWLARGQAVLPVPANAVRLDGLNVGQVDIDSYGTVRVRQGPDLVRFHAELAATDTTSQAPGAADLAVPPRLAATLDEFLAEARGQTVGEAAIANAVSAYLRDHFQYTTRLSRLPGARRTLEAFLRSEREGHCEYFATAAALVLRRAGIPTRYVTGYVADEWSDLEDAYVVRSRHGHAWTLAWIDGRWTEIDATPADWFAGEAKAQPTARGVLDALSWLRFRWSAWNAEATRDDRPSLWWLAVVVPLAAWIVRGVVRRSRRRADATPTGAARTPEVTPIAPLLEALAWSGHSRAPSVSPFRFLMGVAMREGKTRARWVDLARRYRRWRFDPTSRRDGDERALAQDSEALAVEVGRRGPGVD